MNKIYSSEYVSKGHPDKFADLISDCVLDNCLKIDENCHVACECLVSKDLVVISGESNIKLDNDTYKNIVKDISDFCGYNQDESGFDFNDSKIIISINNQSKDIDYAVKNSYEKRLGNSNLHDYKNKIGAGDQGIVVGYACNETPELMPLPYMISRHMIKKFEYLHDQKVLNYLRPVAKSLVSVVYENRTPQYIDRLVLSVQHMKDINQDRLKRDLMENVFSQFKYNNLINSRTQILINPSGCFSIGGPEADTGLTGRKIIVDTYGGRARHGGGAFSGKDASKCDRSGAYLCRWIAKNIVALGYADECEIELLYAIGVAKPIGIDINCFGTNKKDLSKIQLFIEDNFDLSIYNTIEKLELKKPIFLQTTAEGHFGHNNLFNWEKIKNF